MRDYIREIFNHLILEGDVVGAQLDSVLVTSQLQYSIFLSNVLIPPRAVKLFVRSRNGACTAGDGAEVSSHGIF